MGGSPQTTTQSAMPTMDPDIKARLIGNMDMGNWITSGILPRMPGVTTGQPQVDNGTGAVTPARSGTTNIPGMPTQAPGPSYNGQGGQLAGVDASGAPVYINPTTYQYGNDNTGGVVNADGSPAAPPSTFTAGFTPDQLAAFDRIKAQNPLTSAQLGGDIYNDLSTFSAPNVGATSVGATSVTAPTAQAGQVGQVGDVASKNFTDYDFSKYAQPYMSQVVDPVKSYFDTQSDRAASQAAAASRAAGGLRGSSPALAQALARGEIAQQAGMALSPLYQDAFKTSAGLVTSDANRDLQAAQGNQATQLQRTVTQAGLDNSTNLANADSTLRAGLANQDASLRAGMANQNANLQAGIANQGAAISGAGVRSGAAAGLANAAKGVFDSTGIVNNNMLQVGNMQQALNQSRIDDIIKALNIRNSLVTGAVPGTTGQTSTSTQTGGPSQIGGILGGLGSLASGIGALASL